MSIWDQRPKIVTGIRAFSEIAPSFFLYTTPFRNCALLFIRQQPREPDNTEFGTNPTRQKRGRKLNLLEQSTIFLSILVQMHFQEFKKVLSSRIASAQKPGVFRLTRISRSLEVTLTSKRHAQANRHRSRFLPARTMMTLRWFSARIINFVPGSSTPSTRVSSAIRAEVSSGRTARAALPAKRFAARGGEHFLPHSECFQA